jgi:hypothetical protein
MLNVFFVFFIKQITVQQPKVCNYHKQTAAGLFHHKHTGPLKSAKSHRRILEAFCLAVGK